MIYDPNALKYCPRCQSYKLATLKYFQRSKVNKDGFHGCCRVCHGIATKRWKTNNKAHNSEINHDWHELNKERRNASHKLRRQADPAKYTEIVRRSVAKKPEYYKQLSDTYRKNNMGKWVAAAHRRRTREYNAQGTHDDTDVYRIYAQQRGKCCYCQNRVGNSYHVDHVIPLSRGGSNWPSNLAVTCSRCNWSKDDKTPSEWIDRWYMREWLR